LLEAVEGKARELGCCKLTLEVMDNNDHAACIRSCWFFALLAARRCSHGDFFNQAVAL